MQPTGQAGLGAAMKILERQTWLDDMAIPLQQAIASGVVAGGQSARKLIAFLEGKWLGHPLHPALTDVPVGAWTVAVALDLLDGRESGRASCRAGADRALALGVVAALGAAATGLADWHRTTGNTRRVGMAHALLNSGALLLMVASLVTRGAGHRAQGRLLAALGYGIAMTSAYLGGHMVFSQGMGVTTETT
ncbi:MAG TPA: DUF2231 domain-containing protein [Candidatus Binatia bacterium]|nr:DUF2231 domain-containing protein [Candidatus Binatia bacterium]